MKEKYDNILSQLKQFAVVHQKYELAVIVRDLEKFLKYVEENETVQKMVYEKAESLYNSWLKVNDI